MVGKVLDISSYQHPNGATITWAKVKKAGVTTVIVKATEGTTYVNPYFAGDVKGAKAVGLDTLAYHYPSYGTVTAEAEHFIETVGNLTLPRMLDGEGDTTHVAWSNTFLGLIAPTPTERLYYGGSSALSQIGPQMRARLMVADYPAHGAPTVGYPGYGVLWQYTDQASIPGITGPVDESKWYGTEAQYVTLFGLQVPTTSTQEGDMIAATQTAAGYWCAKPTGAVFAYGDATYHGGANTGGANGAPELAAGDRITGIAGKSNDGYWLVSELGAVFAYGSAPYLGGPNQK